MTKPSEGPLRTRWTTWLAVAALLLWIFAVRFPALDDELFGTHNHRMAETAQMARSFAEGPLNILYPQINWSGSSPAYIEEAFQAYTFTVAVLYRAFGEHEAIGRSVSLAFFLATGVIVFVLGRRLYGGPAGVFALFFYGVAPLGVYYGRSFQPDAMNMFLAMSGVLCFLWWSEDEQRWALWLSAVLIALAALTKPVNLYVGLPLGYLAFRHLGLAAVRDPRLWLYALIVFVPTVAYYAHAHGIWIEYGNTAGIWGQAFVKTGTSELLLSSEFYRRMMRRVVDIVTWSGVALVALGCFVRPRRANLVVPVWLFAFGVSILLSAGVQIGHNYYQLPLVPLLALAIGAALGWVWTRLAALAAERGLGTWPPRLAALGLCAAIAWAIAPVTERLLRMPAYQTDERDFSLRLREITEPDALLILGHRRKHGFDQSDERCCRHREANGRFLGDDPIVFYHARRRGWVAFREDWTMEVVDELRAKGAAYFVSWDPVGIQESADFLTELAGTATLVERTDRWVIYALDPARG